MQMSQVGLGFGRQTIIHLRNRDKHPNDKATAENFAKIYIPDNPKLEYDGSSLVITPKNQNLNKDTFLREDAPLLHRIIGAGLDVTYTSKKCDFDSNDNPYTA